jgi:hypothetical protein
MESAICWSTKCHVDEMTWRCLFRFSELFVCGKTDNPLRLSVSSNVGLWPWIGTLGFHTAKKWNHQCGTTLLSSTVLITAAHCAREVKKKTVK